MTESSCSDLFPDQGLQEWALESGFLEVNPVLLTDQVVNLIQKGKNLLKGIHLP
jgi:hypothetical protein